MKIAIHSQVLTAPHLFGIGHYLFNLIHALGQINCAHDYFLLSGRPIKHLPSGNRIVPVTKVPGKCFSYLGFPMGATKLKCDVAFLPKEVTPFGLSIPSVITAYDLYPFKMPKQFKSQCPWTSRIHHHLAKLLHYKRASKILAISEDTKKDLIDICGISKEKIVVTPLGADPLFFESTPSDRKETILKKFNIVSPFFLNTSSLWWDRKNLSNLIHAFAHVKKKHKLPHQLVITGKPGPSLENMKMSISKYQMQNDVKLLNYVDRCEIVALMQSADAFIFPSLHEGFGLPILEAMASGCPVVTSNNSALQEVAGDSAILIDPLQIDSIAHGMETIVMDSAVREQLIRSGKKRVQMFTWENTARITMEAFLQAAETYP